MLSISLPFFLARSLLLCGMQLDLVVLNAYRHFLENIVTTTATMSNRVCHFKLVLLGDTAVGKSCLVVRFVRDEFFEYQEPTIGGK